LSILALHYKPHQQTLDDITDGLLAAATGSSLPLPALETDAAASIDEDMDPVALSEIEKFRLRQAQRDKELAQKKLSKVSDKILAYQRQQQSASEKPAVEEKTKSSSATSYGELLIDNTGSSRSLGTRTAAPSVGERRARENDAQDDYEEAEAKRRRKQQVLRMLAGDSDALDSQPVAVKVKLAPSTSTTTMTKNALTTARADDDDDASKPKRLPVPIDYSEEELKEESNSYHYHPSAMDDDDELQDKLIKRNQTAADISAAAIATASANAMKQAQAISYASSKAAEIAAKISNDMKNLLNSPPSSSSSSRNITSEEDTQKLRQKLLVDQIPTEKNEVFAYPIDWLKADRIDVIDKSMKPWIQKKVVEYLGEEEETLISFILSKLKSHCSPENLLKELEAVLEEDTEPFVIKLWRMLIFMLLKD
jgi:RNA-binding protein 25